MSEEPRHLIVSVEESDSTIGLYDSASGALVNRIEVGFWPHEIEIGPDGKTAYVTNFGVKDYDERIGRPGASISVIDLEQQCEVDRLFTFSEPYEYPRRRAPHGVKLSPKGGLFVNVELAPRMLVFDLADPTKKSPARSFMVDAAAVMAPDRREPASGYPLPEGTHNFVFDKTGETLFIVSGPGGITAVEATTGRTKYRRNDFGMPVRGLEYTPDGKHLIASLRNKLILLNPADLSDHRVLDNGGRGFGVGQFLYSKPTPVDTAGKYEILAPAVWQSQIVVIDPETGALNGRVLVGLDPIHIQVAPDGQQAYVSHGRSKYLSVIDIVQRRVVRQIETRGGPNGIALARYFPRPAKKTLTFGACLPLSGGNGEEGREIRLGYEFWKEKVNAAGGISVGGTPYNVAIAYRDLATGAIGTLARQLIDDEGAQFLLGTYPSPAHLDYGKVAEEKRRPLVTATGAGTVIYEQGHRYVFGIMSPARLYLAGTITLVRMKVQRSRPTVALLSCKDPAAFEDAQATAVFAANQGFEIVAPPASAPLPANFERKTIDLGGGKTADILTFPDGHQDFTAIAPLYRSLDLDLFLMTGHLLESIALTRQAHAAAFVPRGMGLSVGPSLATFRAALGNGVSPEDLFGAAQWTADVQIVGQDPFITPAEFARVFFDRYSMKASYFSAGGYACGLVFEAALRRAGTCDPAAVRDAIAALSMDTFFAHIEFDSRGLNDTKPMYTVQLKAVPDGFEEVVLWPPQGTVWPTPRSF